MDLARKPAAPFAYPSRELQSMDHDHRILYPERLKNLPIASLECEGLVEILVAISTCPPLLR